MKELTNIEVKYLVQKIYDNEKVELEKGFNKYCNSDKLIDFKGTLDSMFIDFSDEISKIKYLDIFKRVSNNFRFINFEQYMEMGVLLLAETCVSFISEFVTDLENYDVLENHTYKKILIENGWSEEIANKTINSMDMEKKGFISKYDIVRYAILK